MNMNKSNRKSLSSTVARHVRPQDQTLSDTSKPLFQVGGVDEKAPNLTSDVDSTCCLNFLRFSDVRTRTVQLDEPLFPHVKYNKVHVPPSLQNLLLRDAPALVWSLISYKTEDRNYREMLRDLKVAAGLISKDPVWFESNSTQNLIRKHILLVFSQFPDVVCQTTEHKYKTHAHHKFEHHVDLHMTFGKPDNFKESKIKEAGKFVSRPPLMIQTKSETNFIFDFISRTTSKRKFLNVARIKSILFTARKHEANFDEEDLLTLITKRLKVWEDYEDLDEMTEVQLQEFYSKMSWIVPYVNPKFMYISFTNESKARNMFKLAIRQLRDRVILFVRQYIGIGNLSPSMREEFRLKRIQVFRNIMRSPPIQMMFAMGMELQHIADHIRENYREQLGYKLVSAQVLERQREKKKLAKSRIISKAREEKYAQNDYFSPIYPFEDIELQSGFFSFLTPPADEEVEVNMDIAEMYKKRLKYNKMVNDFRYYLTYPFLYFLTSCVGASKFCSRKFSTFISSCHAFVDRKIKILSALLMSWRVKRMYNAIVNCFIDPDKHPIPNDFKVLMINIKTAIHVVVAITKKNYSEAAAHGSNYLITCPEVIIKSAKTLSNVDFSWLENTKVTLNFPGTSMSKMVSRQQYEDFWALYSSGQYNSAMELFDGFEEDVEFQSGDINTSSVYDFISTTLNNMVGSCHLTHQDMIKANCQMSFINNVNKTGTMIGGHIMNAISWIGRVLLNWDVFNPAQQIFTRDCLKVINYVNEKLVLTSSDNKSPKQIAELMDMYVYAKTLKQDRRFNECAPYFITFWNQSFLTLEANAKEWAHKARGTGERVEPLSILFTGKPETGKSRATNWLISSLSRVQFGEYDATKCYTFNSSSEYWEKYKKQPFVIIDDLFKEADVQKRAAQATAIIGMVNTAPYNLNMAFGDKGNMFFESQYLFCSTNIANNGFSKAEFAVGLTDSNALKRRFHVVLHRDEKAPSDIKEATFRVDKCDDFPIVVGKTLTVKQILSLLLESQKQHEIKHAGSQQGVEDVHEILNENHFAKFVLNNGLHKDPTRNPYDLLSETEENTRRQFSNMLSETQHNASNTLITEADEAFNAATEVLSWNEQFQCIKDLVNLTAMKMDMTTMTVLIAVIIALGSSAIFLSCFAFGQYFGKDDGIDKQSWKNKDPVYGVSRKPRKQPEVKLTVTPQSSSQNFSIITNLNKSSVSIFSSQSGSTTGSISQGVHMKEGIFLFTNHHFATLKDWKTYRHEIIFYHEGHMSKYDITEHFVDHPPRNIIGMDLCLVDLRHTKLNFPPQMYKRLNDLTPGIYVNLQPGDNIFLLFNHLRSGTEIVEQIIRPCNVIALINDIEYDKYIMDVFSYQAGTKVGFSGAMIVAQIGNQFRLMGMHFGNCATRQNLGLSLNKQLIDDAIRLLDPIQNQSSPDFPLIIDEVVHPQFAHYCPTRSKIRKSIFYEFDEPVKYVPAKLHKFVNDEGVTIDPVVVALSKCKQVRLPAPNMPLEEIYDWLFSIYPRNGGRILTKHEALNGHCKLASSISYGTSAGYPFTLKSKNGKSSLIDFTENGFVMKPFFEEFIDECLAKLYRGDNIEVIWADVLKDETRPIEKVNKGKTRLFSICPAQYLVIMRMFFLDFITYAQEHCVQRPIAVGINAHSLDWTMLHDRLNKKKGSVIAGDFSEYDGTIVAELMEAACEFINRWYNDGEVNARVRRLLFKHITEAKHILFQFKFTVLNSHPSGDPLTAFLNSLVQMIMWFCVLKAMGIPTNTTQLTVYGDDNILTCEREGLKCSDFAPIFKQMFGITYTHWSKDESSVTDTLYTIRYLGRSFVKDGPIYRAPLERDIIMQSLYWVRCSETQQRSVLLSTIRSMAIELSHFGRERFNEEIHRLMTVVRARDIYLHNMIMAQNAVYHYGHYYSSMYTNEVSLYHGSNSMAEIKNNSYDEESNKMFKVFGKVVPNIKTQSKDIKLIKEYFPVQTQNPQQETELDFSKVAPYALASDHGRVDVDEVTSNVYTKLHQFSNMKTEDFTALMSKEVLLTTYTITSDNGFDTQLGQLEFPAAIFSASKHIYNVASNYSYMTAGIEVTFRLTGSNFDTLALISAFEPQPSRDPYTVSSVQIASGYPHVLLILNTLDTCVLRLPYIVPHRASSVYDGLTDNSMGLINTRVASVLRNINGTSTTAKLSIFARFIEPKLFLPVYVAQSNEAHAKASNDSVSNLLTSTKDVIADVLSKKYPILSNMVETVAERATHMDKPSTVQIGSVTSIDPFCDINTGKGVSKAVTITTSVEDRVSSDPTLVSGKIDEMNLLNLAGTPQMYKIIRLDSSTTGTRIASNILAYDSFSSSDTTSLTFIDHVSSNFLYVSGSVKFKFYFVSNSNIRMRCVFYLSDVSTYTTSDAWEHCYHRVVDVCDSQEVSFTVPYLPRHYSVPYSNSSKVLCIKMLSFEKPYGTVDAYVDVLCYKAAGEDYRLHTYAPKKYVAESNPRFEFGSKFEMFSEGMDYYRTEHLLDGENITHLKDIIHRDMPYTHVSATGTPTTFQTYDTDTDKNYINLEAWGLFYRFWRGSINVRVIGRWCDCEAFPWMVTPSVVDNGITNYPLGCVLASRNNPQTYIKMPYIGDAAYKATRPTSSSLASPTSFTLSALQVDGTYPNVNKRFYFKSAGDDFTFHFIAPVPRGSWVAHEGIASLKLYYNNLAP